MFYWLTKRATMKIQLNAAARLQHPAFAADEDEAKKKKIDKMEKELAALRKKANTLNKNGKVAESKKVFEEASKLQKEITKEEKK